MDAFLRGYLECALWSSVDFDTGKPFDDSHKISDFAPEAIDVARQDCEAFREQCASLLDATGATDERNGHDFWLTRNRHGAGFWDRGYGVTGRILTERAYVYGESNVYLGDDGKLYLS
jgi:hypothetical protein